MRGVRRPLMGQGSHQSKVVGTLRFAHPTRSAQARAAPVSAVLRANQTASRGLRRLQSELRLDLFPHHELLDLAGDRHRKFVDEFDIARNLVVRDLSLAEAADLGGRQGLARARPDPGAELLAVAGVRYPEIGR